MPVSSWFRGDFSRATRRWTCRSRVGPCPALADLFRAGHMHRLPADCAKLYNYEDFDSALDLSCNAAGRLPGGSRRKAAIQRQKPEWLGSDRRWAMDRHGGWDPARPAHRGLPQNVRSGRAPGDPAAVQELGGYPIVALHNA